MQHNKLHILADKLKNVESAQLVSDARAIKKRRHYCVVCIGNVRLCKDLNGAWHRGNNVVFMIVTSNISSFILMQTAYTTSSLYWLSFDVLTCANILLYLKLHTFSNPIAHSRMSTAHCPSLNAQGAQVNTAGSIVSTSCRSSRLERVNAQGTVELGADAWHFIQMNTHNFSS